VFVGSGGISTYSAFHLSLKLDKNNTPYLAYSMVMDFWHNQTTVSKFTGTTWVTVGPPYFSGEKSSTLYNSLAFDSNNTPYVAYQDNTTNKDSVMKFNGSAWVPVGSVISATGGGSWTSLALDKNDTPYLAYQETYWGTVIDYKATVRKFNGTDWETLGPVGFSIAGAEYTSLALDSNNTPFVAYDDGGINKGTLMKYYPVLPPTDFNKTSPSNAATDVTPNLVLSWGASTGADSYEYCVDTINNNVCDSNWISAGVKTSVSPTGLKTKTTYYWQSRAVNTGGTTYADASTWESFTTGNNKVYLPYLRR
jgi:hypothetical protein